MAVWLKRATLALVAPLVVLAGLEIVLRLVGFGYPTSYFVPGSVGGTWVENPGFGRRFFPPGLLRVPPPTRVAREKAPGTVRVLVFGESAAMGDPTPAFGVARYLEVLLRERHPGVVFEVVPVAMTAINSHALLPMAKECAALKADFWILYAGNNEMLGPFGAGSALGGRTLPVGLIRWVLAAKSTRLGQGVETLMERWGKRPSGSSRWTGLKVMADEQVGESSPRRARVYKAFERNLRDIVQIGKRSGSRVLLSTVAVNLADCGPFGMASRPDLSVQEAEELARVVDAGRLALTNRVPVLNGVAIRQAAAIDPTHAGLQFLLGWVLGGETNGTSVIEAFSRARDLDTIPLRTDTALNAIIRRVANDNGLALVDAEGVLGSASERGIPGREFFYEHVHLNPEGNHALARAFGEGLEGFLEESVRVGAQSEWASPETCATRLALTPWGRGAAAEGMLRRCLDAPFTNRIDQEIQVVSLAEEISRQRRAQTPQAARFVAGVHTNAIASAPDDPHLRRVYAEFLEATGNLNEALTQWRKVVALLPHHPFAYLQAGALCRRLDNLEEARPLIEKAVAMQPDWVEAWLELADLFLARGRPAEAVAACEAAIRIQPDHARAYFRLADAQAADKHRDKAVQSLQHAIRLDPRLWDARYLLGVEYAVAGQVEPAREQFEEVVRLKPDHALGRFNLGIAYARQGRWELADLHLAEAVRLEPRNTSAREALAQVQAILRQGQGTAVPPDDSSPAPSPRVLLPDSP